MDREQLSHVLRAAVEITGRGDIIVLGSQAILGSFSDERLPMAATRSIEADVAFRDDPGEERADEVDAMIGELSLFHTEYGYYGQGVSVTVATLPAGWQDRLVPFARPDHPEAVCLDAHDLVVAKLYAGREKDYEFARALVEAGLIQVEVLEERIEMLDLPEGVKRRVRDSIPRT